MEQKITQNPTFEQVVDKREVSENGLVVVVLDDVIHLQKSGNLEMELRKVKGVAHFLL